MVTTTCFLVTCGVKVGLWAMFHFSHQDCVTLYWFRLFTASQPFQCLVISMMNVFALLRFESIMYIHHHTPAFELWVVTITVEGPYVSHQDGVFLDWLGDFTASQPYQSFIISIMNGWGRLRLSRRLCIGHHNMFCVVVGVKVGLACIPLFTSRLSVFGLIQAIHSTPTLPMSHY